MICQKNNKNTLIQREFIDNDGKIRGERNFRQICPVKPTTKEARVAFDPNWWLAVDESGEMIVTGKSPRNNNPWDIKESLVRAGTISNIPMAWETLKLFFNSFNAHPVWIKGNYSKRNYDAESNKWTTGLLTTAMVTDDFPM